MSASRSPSSSRETREQALDAAELLDVDYAPLPAVIDARAAPTQLTRRNCMRPRPAMSAFAGRAATKLPCREAMQTAAHVTRLDLVNNRLIGGAIEPRAVLAVADAASDKLTLYSATQVPHHIRRYVAEQLGMAEGSIRLIAPDVGGGFGYKGKHYPEETIVAWAARRLHRPVKWIATRSESFISDNQGRDHLTHAELALDRDGRFLALRVETLANLGAYVSTFGAAIPSAIYSALLAGVYQTPAIFVQVTGVFTNTLPTDAYRGAGRPEACYVLERLADRAAAELCDRSRRDPPAQSHPRLGHALQDADRADLRLRRFSQSLRARAGHGRLSRASRKRRTHAARAGRLRGIGMACYVESSGVAPSRFAGMLGARTGFFEAASIRVQPDGGIQALLGTHNHGQGHATTLAQILRTRLGVPLGKIEIVEGDTDLVPYGTGTFGSRSIAVGGSALDRAAGKIIAKGKLIAAHLLEASAGDVDFADGVFSIAGTDRSLTFAEVAHAANVPHNFPLETLEPGLQETAVYDPPAFAFSNGAHVCEIEIDPETGATRLVGYWGVDDVGTVINPMIVDGQVHGGVAQGLGQALCELCRYDADGQLLSGSFMDYALPRAADLPLIESELDESQPCTHNPLGAKGCGEAGAIAAPAAIVSAVLDALSPLGVTDIDMPLTSEAVWRAIASAKQTGASR